MQSHRNYIQYHLSKLGLISPPPPTPPHSKKHNDRLPFKLRRDPDEALSHSRSSDVLPVVDLKKRYDFTATFNLGEGGCGNVRQAKRIKHIVRRTNAVPHHHTKGTLMEKSDNFENENIKNKRLGYVAIKTFKKKRRSLDSYSNNPEVLFIKKMAYHPNLIQIHDIFIGQEDCLLHIVMEKMDMSLHDLIQNMYVSYSKLDVETVRSILTQLLSAIGHIHSKGFIHRDIKPSNVLIMKSQDYYGSGKNITGGEYVAKLADYGLAKYVGDCPATNVFVGTEGYQAPELLLGDESYSQPSDIFSFGALAYELVTMKSAFVRKEFYSNMNITESYKLQAIELIKFLGTPSTSNILPESYKPRYGYWGKGSCLLSDMGLGSFLQTPCENLRSKIKGSQWRELRQVITACLSWNPNQRPTVDDLFQMPFFQNNSAHEDN